MSSRNNTALKITGGATNRNNTALKITGGATNKNNMVLKITGGATNRNNTVLKKYLLGQGKVACRLATFVRAAALNVDTPRLWHVNAPLV